MGIGFSTTLRNARSQQIIDALDADTSPGYIELYTATQPATGAAITTQTKLGTLTLSKPCGSISSGVLTFDAIAQDSIADASGDIAFGRAYDGAGTFILDMSAGNNVSSEPLKFNTVTVQAGGIIQITSGTLTEGNL